jgi:hypothetical protein
LHVASLLAPVAFEYFPAPHETHVSMELAVMKVEYLPAGHSVQVCESSGEYVPAGQDSTVTVLAVRAARDVTDERELTCKSRLFVSSASDALLIL